MSRSYAARQGAPEEAERIGRNACATGGRPAGLLTTGNGERPAWEKGVGCEGIPVDRRRAFRGTDGLRVPAGLPARRHAPLGARQRARQRRLRAADGAAVPAWLRASRDPAVDRSAWGRGLVLLLRPPVLLRARR